LVIAHPEPVGTDFGKTTDADHVGFMGDVQVVEVIGPSGVEYQIETEVIWDSPREMIGSRRLRMDVETATAIESIRDEMVRLRHELRHEFQHGLTISTTLDSLRR
jgi:hypothetical protein